MEQLGWGPDLFFCALHPKPLGSNRASGESLIAKLGNGGMGRSTGKEIKKRYFILGLSALC